MYVIFFRTETARADEKNTLLFFKGVLSFCFFAVDENLRGEEVKS